jgi:dolichol-phosphate mannosyltransferase
VLFTAAQAAAAAIVLKRLAKGCGRRPPIAATQAPPPQAPVTVLIPARDEADRIGPVLEATTQDPDVTEVLVVDDQSADATAQLARDAGARVIAGRELPQGWVGKPWALQQGLEVATGDIVACLDADTRPHPGLVRALTAQLERDTDLVTGGVRFRCEGVAERMLHPALLATLVYRYGPIGVDAEGGPARRVLANGQCLAFRRASMLAAGGFEGGAGHLTDDVAHARALVAQGWRVRFVDCADLIEVRMYEGARDTWRGWGRSIAMADVTPPLQRALDLAVVWLALALPLPRVLLRKGTPLDVALAAIRLALVAPLGRAYAPRGVPYWLSPAADLAAATRLTLSSLRPSRSWRGRTYPSGTAPRSGT